MSPSKISQIPFVGWVGLCGELVSSGIANVPDLFFEVVFVVGESPGQFVEKLGVGGRIGNPYVINRFDDALSEEVSPNQVSQISREEGVFRRSAPIGQDLTSVVSTFDFRSFSTKEFGRHGLFVNGVVDFSAFAVVNDGLSGIGSSFPSYLTEKGSEGIVIVLGPLIKRVVMALGALDTHSHKYLGDVFGDLEVVAVHLVVVGRGIDEGASRGSQQFPDDLIHGNVVGDSILEPIEVEQSGLIAHSLVVIGLDLQKFGELHHPNFGEFLAIQQFVDEFGAFVRTRPSTNRTE